MPVFDSSCLPVHSAAEKKAFCNHKEPAWKPITHQRHTIPTDYLHWVEDSGSLTKKLVNKANGHFSVSVLRQSIRSIPLSEKSLLQNPLQQWALVREVVLYGNNIPWVYARTAIPIGTLKGPLRRLHYLGNRPLGEQLFTDPTMQRGHLEAAKIYPHHIPDTIAKSDNALPETTWGRRSVFYLSSQPLLVSEIFLPALVNASP
ncbi:chorismate--pyruvate lyase family protein [Eionea flava]